MVLRALPVLLIGCVLMLTKIKAFSRILNVYKYTTIAISVEWSPCLIKFDGKVYKNV